MLRCRTIRLNRRRSRWRKWRRRWRKWRKWRRRWRLHHHHCRRDFLHRERCSRSRRLLNKLRLEISRVDAGLQHLLYLNTLRSAALRSLFHGFLNFNLSFCLRRFLNLRLNDNLRFLLKLLGQRIVLNNRLRLGRKFIGFGTIRDSGEVLKTKRVQYEGSGGNMLALQAPPSDFGGSRTSSLTLMTKHARMYVKQYTVDDMRPGTPAPVPAVAEKH